MQVHVCYTIGQKEIFRKLYCLCLTAQAFQDAPFSSPYTFQYLDYKFPGSKFILTVRNDPDQWYRSLVNYMSVTVGNGNIPTKEKLKTSLYVKKGFKYDRQKLLFNVPDDDLFNKDILIKHYVSHFNSVVEYFRYRPNDLLILNVADSDANDKLCDFLGKPRVNRVFPHLNKTRNLG